MVNAYGNISLVTRGKEGMQTFSDSEGKEKVLWDVNMALSLKTCAAWD